MNLLVWLILLVIVTLICWLIIQSIDRPFLKKNGLSGPSGREWPILAKTADRNEAFMIKALLDDANIDSIVEEDTTLGILYGAQSITDYPIRVPEQKLDESRGLLKESSFADTIVRTDKRS